MNQPLNTAAGLGLDQPQQVEQDEQVSGNQANPYEIEVPDELEELPGKKSSGKDQRDVFRPYFFQRKPNALYKINGSVQKDSQAEHAQVARTDESSLSEDVVDRATVWIEPQARHDPMV